MNKPRLTVSRVCIYAFLVLSALFFALPTWFAFMASFKTLPDLQSGNLFGLPNGWTIAPWKRAWQEVCTGIQGCTGMMPYFRNSLIVVIPSTLISTVWAGFNGYVISKWKFRGSEFVFFLLLFGLFLPTVMFLFPLSLILHRLGMSSSLLSLVLVHIIYSLPLALYFRNYFSSFPGELIKAARIDGAGLFTIFWRILLPSTKPIFVVVLIMQFTSIWNEFLFALILAPYDQQLVTVGLTNLTGSQIGTPETNVYMAAALMVALPTVLIYVVAGKYFVRGLTAGAVKG
ncbi:carbohydrate ABC transporter permease [Leeia sp.]|uniref:carbohydrate ABC transporter permease n=1 Tax=Leeia sp. TaxID=2884678 RepID=UPI0035ADE719